MKKEEFEDFIFDLIEKIHKNKNEFIIDKKIKDLLEEFYLFREIISNFPDKYNSILNEILSNLNLKKYNRKEVVFDNNIESINDIFIIFKGEIIINNYFSIEEIESNEKEEINQNMENRNVIIYYYFSFKYNIYMIYTFNIIIKNHFFFVIFF